MTLIFFGAFLILGAIFGSYLFTTALRISQQIPLGGRSFCDSCKVTLSPFSLIPIFGYLFAKGKCRHCGAKIPLSYPLFEFLCGLSFGMLALQIGLDWELLHILVIFSVLLVIALVDFWSYEIPTGPVVIGLAAQGLWLNGMQPAFMQDALLGLLLGAGVFHWISTLFYYFRKKDGLGRGDATLLGLIGFYLGWQPLIPVIFIASLLGVFGGAVLLLLERKSFHKEIAFGPWLILASAILWGFPQLLEGLYSF